MAFAHCRNCDWSQDDFWDEHYNPIKSIKDREKEFLEMLDKPINERCVKLDGAVTIDANTPRNVTSKIEFKSHYARIFLTTQN